jgi:hypothetical protein
MAYDQAVAAGRAARDQAIAMAAQDLQQATAQALHTFIEATRPARTAYDAEIVRAHAEHSNKIEQARQAFDETIAPARRAMDEAMVAEDLPAGPDSDPQAAAVPAATVLAPAGKDTASKTKTGGRIPDQHGDLYAGQLSPDTGSGDNPRTAAGPAGETAQDEDNTDSPQEPEQDGGDAENGVTGSADVTAGLFGTT